MSVHKLKSKTLGVCTKVSENSLHNHFVCTGKISICPKGKKRGTMLILLSYPTIPEPIKY